MVKYKLVTPVKFDDKTYSEIEFSKPKGKHLKKIGLDPKMEDVIIVASKVSGVPLRVFDEMDAGDYLKINEIVGDFLAGGRNDGVTTSP